MIDSLIDSVVDIGLLIIGKNPGERLNARLNWLQMIRPAAVQAYFLSRTRKRKIGKNISGFSFFCCRAFKMVRERLGRKYHRTFDLNYQLIVWLAEKEPVSYLYKVSDI